MRYFLVLAILARLSPGVPYIVHRPPAGPLHRQQRFVDDVDELIRSSVQAFAAESSLLRSVLPPPPASVRGDRPEAEDSPELVEHDFDRLLYHSDGPPDTEAYNSLLRAWLGSGRADAADQCDEVFARLRYADQSPNQETFELMIRAWALEGGGRAARKALEYFRWGRSFNLTSSTCELLMSSLLQHLGDDEAVEGISQVVSYLKESSLPISDAVWTAYLELVLKCSPNPLETIDSYLEECSEPAERRRLLEQFLIRALCQLPGLNGQRLSRASSLFSQLVSNASRISVLPAVYVDFTRAVCERGTTEDVSGVLEMLKQASCSSDLVMSIGVQPWNAVLETLIRNTSEGNSVLQLIDIFQIIKDRNVPADEHTYQAVIKGLFNAGDYEQALKLWTSMPSNIRPTFETYRCKILSELNLNESSNATEGKFLEAVICPTGLHKSIPLLQEMMATGFNLNLDFFREFLRVLQESHQWGAADVAIRLFKLVDKERSFQADLSCFESLFGTFKQSLSLSHAENAFNALAYMDSLGVKPSVKIYESLLWTWVHSRRYVFLDILLDNGFYIDQTRLGCVKISLNE